MSQSAQAIKQTLTHLLVERQNKMHPLSDEFAEAVDQYLMSMGWLLSQHEGPLSPYAQGAIELAEMQRQLEDKGFQPDHAFELVKMIFTMNIKAMGLGS
ncbi:hypothetical protein SEA_BISKIT_62 [Gordonia phage Biskit]|uniref:Uncharacterized protein n=4 Tax=Emalynvirus troje TaxID=2560511 RepID=A0A2K9VES8_9CAUD|nr:hypothetical protein FDJ27_gp62 [Gordonia phage Troje]AXH45160.1 hypothetical protein SEA_SKETCHMEX_60 [Gordonia phage SketchMex]QNJ59492.1 hypothetical protein SEA_BUTTRMLKDREAMS_62 [Gordonia phage Buttrmlkdreams]QWY84935.1 hypothetical protein SEA_MSCARN_64 [Gordonia phage MScarn]UVK62101.1 hypothetical protein SEA_BISKIT_62 [Gordonia phage Biskit]WKW85126.1 hypothetical protein SEA_YUMMY_62 [Gordonia phage Yummy]WKW86937.1 hypothetical protein SEA_HORSERADISH_62 [Gordonia phage Horserad